jgi:aminopeptidase N
VTIKDNLTREEAAQRAALLSDLRYDVSLDQTKGPDAYRCEVAIRFRCSSPGASTFLDFVGGAIEEAQLNGRELPASIHDGERIHLENLEAENELRLATTVTYSGTGVGIHRFEDPVDGLVYTHSDYEPFDAHRAFPCFDQPDMKGRFRFSVRTPEGWLAVSNSAPDGVPVPDGDGAIRWTFTETPAISPYITALVSGPFHVLKQSAGGIEMGLWCRQSMAEHMSREAAELFEVTRQGFAYFQERFDYPYPFGAKYDQLFVPDFLAGAMENAACVTFNELYLFRSKVTDAARERRAETVLHELAHMWFGDLVTMRWWDDVWLNESFATYVSTRALAEATRFRDGWVSFADGEKTWAYQQDQLPTTHAITTDVPDTQSIRLNFDGITYAKGASVLKQLAAWVGDDAFFEGLRIYFRRHEWGNTTLADFLSALEETSGRDLHAWSAEWLETPGLNTLRAAYQEAPGSDPATFGAFRVEQSAPPDWPLLRSHRLAIGLYDEVDGHLLRRTRVEVDVPKTADVPELVGATIPALTLVNDDDLTYSKIRLDERSMATLRERMSAIGDPLARALCWASAWDMVRDAELPTGWYVDMVLRHAPAEGDIGTLQRLLGQARAAIDAYGDPALRDERLARVAAAAWSEANGAEPGGEQQLAWIRAWAASAGSDEDRARMHGLLDGPAEVPGLDVDTEMRWHLVGSLASQDRDAELYIAAELERDPTSQGRDHAAAARASRPSTEAKTEAWASFLPTPPLPPPTLMEVLGGFQRYGQRELLEPFVDRYFETLPDLWEQGDIQTAMTFTRDAFPRVIIGQRTLDATDRFIRSESPTGPARRLLVEGQDRMDRAIRARAADTRGA